MYGKKNWHLSLFAHQWKKPVISHLVSIFFYAHARAGVAFMHGKSTTCRLLTGLFCATTNSRFSFWVNSCFILIVCVSPSVLPGFLPVWLLNLCEWERTWAGPLYLRLFWTGPYSLRSVKASKTNCKESWKLSVHIKNCTLTTPWLKYKANAISYFFISLSPANRAALDSIYRLSKDCLIDPSSWRSFATFLQLFHLTLSASASAFAAGNGRYLQGFFPLISYIHSMCGTYIALNPQIELPTGYRTKSKRKNPEDAFCSHRKCGLAVTVLITQWWWCNVNSGAYKIISLFTIAKLLRQSFCIIKKLSWCVKQGPVTCTRVNESLLAEMQSRPEINNRD